MLDSDLAALYGVATKALTQAVKRNLRRFPEDFMFRLTAEEWTALRSQFVTSKHGERRGGRRYLGVHDRRKAVGRAVTEAGVEGSVRIHDFRHTAYTHLKQALEALHDPKVVLGNVKLIFGHSDRSMDATYDHRTVERLRKVMAIMPLVKGVEDLLAA